MKFVSGFLAAAFLFVAVQGAFAQSYNFSVIQHPDANQTLAYGINDKGYVVGSYPADNGSIPSRHGYVFDGENYTTFYLNGFDTTLTGINNQGQIIGSYRSSYDDSHGFMYDGGKIVSLDYPGASYTRPLDINNSGEILSSYRLNDVDHYYVYKTGNFENLDLNFPGAVTTHLLGFNDEGQIVGAYDKTGGGYATNGFLYSDGEFQTITHPLYPTGLADINNSGQIVGTYQDEESNVPVGFLYENNTIVNLPIPSDILLDKRPETPGLSRPGMNGRPERNQL